MGRDLLSKIAAGGLSAGIFLLWWPLHLPSDGLAWLILRGVLWTLAVEALLLAFVPLERMLIRGVRTERLAGLRARVLAAPARLRACAAVCLALAGFAAPMALLAEAAEESSPLAAERPQVIRQVIVERPVIERRVVVREVPVAVTAPAKPAVAPTAASYAPARSLPAAAPSPTGDRSPEREPRAPGGAPQRTREREAGPVAPAPPAAPGAESETPAGRAGGAADPPAAGSSRTGGELVLAGEVGDPPAGSAPAPV